MSSLRLAVLSLLATTATVIIILLALPKPTAKIERTHRTRPLFNPGGGDCLFYCFLQAMESQGRHTTIAKLRDAVARNVTEEQFQTLREIYHAARQRGDAGLVADYQFVKNCNTLEDLREAMRKSSYFGDELAIATLERVSGLRAIILNDRYDHARRLDETPLHPNDPCIVIHLQNVHYQLLSFDHHIVLPCSQALAQIK